MNRHKLHSARAAEGVLVLVELAEQSADAADRALAVADEAVKHLRDTYLVLAETDDSLTSRVDELERTAAKLAEWREAQSRIREQMAHLVDKLAASKGLR